MQATIKESAGHMRLSQIGSEAAWWSVATQQVQNVAKAALLDTFVNDDVIHEVASHLPTFDMGVLAVFAKEGKAMQKRWRKMFGLLAMAEDVHEYMTGSKTSDVCGAKRTTNSIDFTEPWHGIVGKPWHAKCFTLTYAPRLWVDAFLSQPDIEHVDGETQRVLKALLHAKGYTAGFSKSGVTLFVAPFDERLHAAYATYRLGAPHHP